MIDDNIYIEDIWENRNWYRVYTFSDGDIFMKIWMSDIYNDFLLHATEKKGE